MPKPAATPIDSAAIPQAQTLHRRNHAGHRPGHLRLRSCFRTPRSPRPSKAQPRSATGISIAHRSMATRPKSALSLEEILRGGITREDLWITSKLWNDKHGEDDVIALLPQIACRSAPQLPRPLPGPLALSQFPSARLRREFALAPTPSLTSTKTT